MFPVKSLNSSKTSRISYTKCCGLANNSVKKVSVTLWLCLQPVVCRRLVMPGATAWLDAIRGVVLKKEVWERLSHTKSKEILHQILRLKWAFAYKNFHTGSSCVTVDFCLAVRICVSPAYLWDRSHVNVIVWIPHCQPRAMQFNEH